MVAKKARKVAAAGGRVAGSGAGGFLTGIFSSPAGLGAIGIGTLLVVIFIFRDRIAAALGGLGGAINIELPKIEFPTIEFPTFEFPTFEFPTIEFPTFEFPTFENPFEDFEFPTFELPTFEFPDFQQMFDDFIAGFTGGQNGNGVDMPTEPSDFTDTGQAAARARQEDELAGADIPIRDITDDPTSLTPAQRFAFIERGVIPSGFEVIGGVLQPIMQIINNVAQMTTPILSNLPTGFEAFQVGESGFVGAQINPTPIENLSLSQIIDMFGVTASQAANIRAIAADDFGDFDFGTNTGFGIGSVLGSLSSFIPSSVTNVSDTQFQGLSAQEIANILTGGNIQNF